MTPIPFTLISGYLGSGKTTLLNRILSENDGRRYAVIVNDFGAINIDDSLISSRSATRLALANGCVCCTIGQSLAAVIADVVQSEPPPEHIIMEASGVADPARLKWLHRAAGLRFSSVVTLADLSTVQDRMSDKYVGRLVENQLSFAQVILTTKADLCDDPNDVEQFLTRRFEGHVMPAELFLGGNLEEHEHVSEWPGAPALEMPTPDFSHVVWRSNDRFTRSQAEAFARALAPRCERAKGWVLGQTDGESDYLIQTAGPSWSVDVVSTNPNSFGLVVQIFAPEVDDTPVAPPVFEPQLTTT